MSIEAVTRNPSQSHVQRRKQRGTQKVRMGQELQEEEEEETESRKVPEKQERWREKKDGGQAGREE